MNLVTFLLHTNCCDFPSPPDSTAKYPNMFGFGNIPGIYLSCSEEFVFSDLLTPAAECNNFPLGVIEDWSKIPPECQPKTLVGDHLPPVDSMGAEYPMLRLFTMSSLPGYSEASPRSFVSALHRYDLTENTTDSDSLKWEVDSLQMFMADDIEDPTRLSFRQIWDASLTMKTSTGCTGHWQFYPDQDRWYDAQGFGLAEIVDFTDLVNKNSAGLGTFRLVRIDEVPTSYAEVKSICSDRESNFKSPNDENGDDDNNNKSLMADNGDTSSGNSRRSRVRQLATAILFSASTLFAFL